MIKPHNLVAAKLGASPEAQDILTTICLMFKKAENKERNKSGKPCKDDEIDLSQLPREYTISRQALSEIWGKELRQIPYKPREVFNPKTNKAELKPSVLQEACESLLTGIIRIPISGSNHGDFTSKVLFTEGRFDKNGLTMVLNEDGKKLLFDVTKGFASLDLNVYFKLKSKFSKRLFELLTRYKSIDPKFTIKKIEDHFDVNRSDYAHFSHFSRATLLTPIKEIVEVSKNINGSVVWDFSNADFPNGLEVKRTMKNRTLDNDDVIIHIKPQKVEKEAKVDLQATIESEIEIPEELIELSKIVKAWRSGNRPTHQEYHSIATKLVTLADQNLLSFDAFAKLSKEFPPL